MLKQNLMLVLIGIATVFNFANIHNIGPIYGLIGPILSSLATAIYLLAAFKKWSLFRRPFDLPMHRITIALGLSWLFISVMSWNAYNVRHLTPNKVITELENE